MKTEENLIQKFVHSCKDIEYKDHCHNEYQMIYVMKGSIQIVFSNKTYIANENSIIFISNLENHSLCILEKPYERYYVTISIRALEKAVLDSALLSVFKNRPVSFTNVFPVEAISSEIVSLFTLMEAEYNRTPDEYSEKRFGYLMNLLLLSVYRNNSDLFPLLRENVKSQIYDIQKFIDHHYHESISLQNLCKEFYISFSYFSRCFKELTGYSPKQYIMLHRLIHARSLILTTDSSISDIAFKSGFSDVNNFIRHFKQEYGLTPMHLRKHYSK